MRGMLVVAVVVGEDSFVDTTTSLSSSMRGFLLGLGAIKDSKEIFLLNLLHIDFSDSAVVCFFCSSGNVVRFDFEARIFSISVDSCA